MAEDEESRPPTHLSVLGIAAAKMWSALCLEAANGARPMHTPDGPPKEMMGDSIPFGSGLEGVHAVSGLV